MIRQAAKLASRRQKAAKPNREKGSTNYDNASVVVESPKRESSDSFKTYVLWSILGTAAAGTVIYLGWKLVTDKISNRENRGSLDSEDPAFYAKQFKIGFDNNNWYGSDTETVRESMLAIPSKDFFEKVSQSYQKQYKSSLFKDLEKHLKSTEYQEMQAIYKIKPQKTGGQKSAPIYDPYAWATRIHAAVNYETMGLFWGTDLNAIKQVIREVENQSAWNDLKAAYESKYSLDITEDIDGDVDSGEYDFRNQLQKKSIAV